jgi:hypothetical protein
MVAAQLAITTLVALIGLYFAHSYRRQQQLRIAERRLDAYRDLWCLMEVARPTRVKHVNVDQSGALKREEALDLYHDMTAWYFGSGGGLLLPDDTKRLYLKVKEKLGDFAIGRKPWCDECEGRERMDEIGVLRAQMRLDLDIYSVPYMSIPDSEDTKPNEATKTALLKDAHIDPRALGAPPWRARLAKSVRDLGRRATAGLPPRVRRADHTRSAEKAEVADSKHEHSTIVTT